MSFVSTETGKALGQVKSGTGSTKGTDARKSTFTENAFTSALQDPLKVIDCYGLKSSSPINFLDQFKKQFDQILGGLIGGGQGKNLFSEALDTFTKGQSTLNVDSLKNQIGSLSGVTDKIFGSLNDSFKSDLLNKISNIDEITANVNGVIDQIKNTNWDDLNSITATIGNLTGNSSFVTLSDSVSKVLGVSSVIKTAIESNLPGVTEQIVESTHALDSPEYPFVDLEALLASEILPTVIRQSDDQSLKYLGTINGDRGLESVNPIVINEFVTGYQQTLTGQRSVIQKFTEVMASFRAVNSKWEYEERETEAGTDEAIDLTTLVNSSAVFVELLNVGCKSSDENDVKMLLFHEMATKDSMEQIVKKYFPLTVYTPATTSVLEVVDPRTLV